MIILAPLFEVLMLFGRGRGEGGKRWQCPLRTVVGAKDVFFVDLQLPVVDGDADETLLCH